MNMSDVCTLGCPCIPINIIIFWWIDWWIDENKRGLENQYSMMLGNYSVLLCSGLATNMANFQHSDIASYS